MLLKDKGNSLLVNSLHAVLHIRDLDGGLNLNSSKGATFTVYRMNVFEIYFLCFIAPFYLYPLISKCEKFGFIRSNLLSFLILNRVGS